MGKMKRGALRAASYILPTPLQDRVVSRLCGDLRREMTDVVTDGFLQSLLGAMEIAFALSRSYRKNIEGFQAVYVFRTRGEEVGATALFQGGSMSVESEPRSTFDTRLTFKDAEGLLNSLVQGDENILETMLSNPVEVDGNLNCLYRFGYFTKELTMRLEVA